MSEEKAGKELSNASMEVLERRYLIKDDNGKIIETPDDLFKRVAKTIAKAETKYPKGPKKKDVESAFYKMISDLDFMPNSPTLMNAGRTLGQLSACFVLPVGDSMREIFDSIKNAALIHQSGGGTGFSFSRLRAKGSSVKTTQGVASGPISFMTAFNAATETVKQGGTRRGANMGILRVDHPDIMDFITAKEDNSILNNFNISVAVTDEFMRALDKGGNYNLYAPKDKKKVGELSAKKIWNEIVERAWKNGEPGIVFIDRINKENPTPHIGEIESTNPCGEQPLLPYESCNLGSINLTNFVKSGKIDYERLEEITRLAVRFLDDVIDVNKYPIKEISEMTKANRKIGLGVMGLADMLAQLEIPYNSEEGVRTSGKVMKFIQDKGRELSEELARERGTFPSWKGSVWQKKGIKMRNATVTTIAPTGTISMIADSSSGVEPLFAISFVKNVMDKDELVMTSPVFLRIAKERGFYSEELVRRIAKEGTLHDIDEVPKDVKNSFVVAHDVTPEWHIKMQAEIQKYTDNAVSKTVNFPNTATRKDVEKVYLEAYSSGCKGVTIYRDGSRDEQVLNIGKVNKKDDKKIALNSKEGTKVPKERPVVTHGQTIRMMTGCGKLYITINKNDEEMPFEIFSTMGKAGGCAASQAEAISRMVSMSLRSGMSVNEIVKNLKYISCHRPYGFGPNRITSCSDAIAKAMEKFIEPTLKFGTDEDEELKKVQKELESIEIVREEIKEDNHVGGVCKECGGPIEYESGCLVCRSCGYSECG